MSAPACPFDCQGCPECRPELRLEFTRVELNAAMRKAFELGQEHPKLCAAAPEVIALLEDLSP